jgi:colanic acid/amylovoran biosynthesis glycosyltransferase
LDYFKALFSSLFNEEKDILRYLKLIFHFFVSLSFAMDMKIMKISHIHAHFTNVAATIAMYAARISGASYSITLHSPVMPQNPYDIGLKDKIKGAKFLCSVSEYNADSYERICHCKDKIFVIHCGVELNPYFDTQIDYFPKDRNRINLVSIGRLVEKKGFKYLIEACGYLSNEGVNFKLTMIGDGVLRKELEDQSRRHGLGNVIIFKGNLSGPEIAEVLNNSDICIVPSVEDCKGEKEGIPVVIMEAMAEGVPVIATRHSGIEEIVKDRISGMLVPEKDPVSIAASVKELANDFALRRQCIFGAREKVLNEFNIKIVSRIKKDLFCKHILC